MKVQWDDGEQVTWRRDSLAERPIEMRDPAGEEDQVTASPEPDDLASCDSAEASNTEPETAPYCLGYSCSECCR